MTTADLIETTYSRGFATARPRATRVISDTVVCDACGCRLTSREGTAAGTWFHYPGYDGRDARGCAVACAEAAHTLG